MRNLLLTSLLVAVLQTVSPDPDGVIIEYEQDLNKFYFSGGCALVYGFVYENGTSRPLSPHDREVLANYTAQYYVYVPCLCDDATCNDVTWCKNETVAYISGGCALQDDYVYDNGTMRAVTDQDKEIINNYSKAFKEYMSNKFNDSYTGPEQESPKIPCFCKSAICADDMK